jgi:hypothetical protein
MAHVQWTSACDRGSLATLVSHWMDDVSLLMSPLVDTGLAYGLHIKRTGHNPPRGPSAGWWVNVFVNCSYMDEVNNTKTMRYQTLPGL